MTRTASGWKPGVPGERFDELGVSTTLKASPETIVDYLFGRYLDEKNANIRRSFIQRGPELTLWSDVLSTPVTSERCYSMRFERQGDAKRCAQAANGSWCRWARAHD